eukprot:gene6036-11411_t
MDHPEEAIDNREVKFTYEELLEQNKSLAEELTQCRADKDFVWTLWKRLQADKPDVSSAVSMVIQREQEKAEAKDRKILAILKEKDNNIRILEEIAADLEVQLKQSMERLSGLLVDRTEWEGKIDELRKTVQKLDEEKIYQQEVMKARENQNENERKNYLAENEALAKSNKECSERIKDLELEVDKLSKEKSSAATLMETNTVLRDKIKVLEKDLELTKREHDEKISKLKLREGQLLEETIAVNEQLEQVEQKDAEIAALSSELRKMRYDHEECLNHIEEQNAIIKNLQLLQDETQLILKNQQESHKSEVKSYKNTLNELRMKCLSLQSTSEKLHGDTDALRKSLSVRQRENIDKDMVIADLKESLKTKHEGFDSETQTVDLNCSRCRELEEQLDDVKDEFDSLKDIVQEKGRRISSLEKVLSEQRRRNMVSKEDNDSEVIFFCLYIVDLGFQTQDDDQFAESNSNFKSRIRSLEKEIEDLSTLLTLKDIEVQETRRAHSRRLQRYKSLKENYSMINKQLLTFQQDAPLKAINDVNIRADPKSLQREDSEAVWNELAFYRKQYNLLKNEREDLEEEFDNLRVKTMAANAKIKELEIELDHEHSECLKLRSEMQSKAKFVSPSKMYSMETQVEIWRKKSKQLELQNEALNAEKEALTQREKYYKKEIVGLTDEIDHIHKNIRDKIDAEVQASEAIEALEQQANKSLDRIATSVNDRKRHLIEQYIQTSPISPIRRLSPKRPISQSTQSTQTIDSESSSEHEFPLSRIPNHIRHKPKRQGPERDVLKECDKLFAEDLQTPNRNIRKVTNSLSPVLNGKIYKRKKMPLKSSPAVREQTSLKVRILSLQQQVDVLRSGKSRLSAELQEQKEYNETAKGELDVAVKKLEMSKVTIQRLSDEVQRCCSDRENLEKELENERKKTKPPEIGYKEMENRWKLATTECSKLSFQVKTLRGENEMMSAKQREFQERIVWLERQLNQKKQLLEDMKEKLKETNQMTAKEKEVLIDDLRNKINQLSLEKIELKKQLQECKEELKRKSRLLQQSQDLCSHAEKAVSEMEKAAFDQLHEQATEQEKLYANLKQDLSTERGKVVEYQWVIKNLVEVVLKDTHHLQLVIVKRRRLKRDEEIKKQKSQESMKEARDIACSILDMTSEEIELLLDEEPREQLDDTTGDDVRDILKTYFISIERFSKRLLKLLLELLGKHWKLRMQEQLGIQT